MLDFRKEINRSLITGTVALSVCVSALLTGGCGTDLPFFQDVNALIATSGTVDPEHDYDIRPLALVQLGKHLYCPEGGFFLENEYYPDQNGTIRKVLEMKDKEQEPDLFVTEHRCSGNSEGVTRVQLFACAYINGVVIEDMPFRADSADDHRYFTKMFGHKITYPDKRGVKSADNILPVVEELAAKNTELMLMDRGNTIYGTYLLKLNSVSEHYYYEFVLNKHSVVKVDARTGKVIEYFFQGGQRSDSMPQ